LFLVEDAPLLSDNQLASRLSYFLWRTSPDGTLREIAARGELTKPEVLRRETERLISSPRFDAFVDDFLNHWLNLREIEATTPDRDLYPEYFESYHDGTQDGLLHQSIVMETRAFVRDLIERDAGIEYLVRSPDVFLNQRLADHYGLPAVKGTALRRVSLPADSMRGGLLTQASVLKVTANGANTSPVIRGVWILERVLGSPAPPPPPNVGSIEPDTRGATTIREQLAKHKADKNCAVCHLRQQSVKTSVQTHITRKVFVIQTALVQQEVNLVETGIGLLQQNRTHSALCGHSRRQPLERAAQLNGVSHIALRKSAHRITTPRQCVKQTLLAQSHEGNSNGCARHAQACYQSQFCNATASSQMSCQDQFTQALLRFNSLRAAFFSSFCVLNGKVQRGHDVVFRKQD
jgi:hypothetical protein